MLNHFYSAIFIKSYIFTLSNFMFLFLFFFLSAEARNRHFVDFRMFPCGSWETRSYGRSHIFVPRNLISRNSYRNVTRQLRSRWRKIFGISDTDYHAAELGSTRSACIRSLQPQNQMYRVLFSKAIKKYFKYVYWRAYQEFFWNFSLAIFLSFDISEIGSRSILKV